MLRCLDFTLFLSQREISRCTLECIKVAKYVRHAGRLPGSLEPDSTAGVDYWVADGHLIRRHVPALAELYDGPDVIDFLESLSGLRLERVPDEASCMNMNVLPAGYRYERHLDDWGVALVVNMTSCGGGRLLLGGAPIPHVVPEVGKGIFFDGQRYPHEVETVTSGIRASLIFEYLVRGREVKRSKGLSNALYGL